MDQEEDGDISEMMGQMIPAGLKKEVPALCLLELCQRRPKMKELDSQWSNGICSEQRHLIVSATLDLA